MTVDALASVSCEIFENEYIAVILHGLPFEYDAFIISLSTISYDYTIDEVESPFMTQEAKIEKHIKSLDSSPSTLLKVTLNPNSEMNYNRRPYGSYNSYSSRVFLADEVMDIEDEDGISRISLNLNLNISSVGGFVILLTNVIIILIKVSLDLLSLDLLFLRLTIVMLLHPHSYLDFFLLLRFLMSL
ncbi:conserved hypothetical protein [Ricinus communis]|uniref:Uncharacterized protein n=1 Tax=Ricinus communis TaxID=3988 RepID=B9SWQ8_RICCO|nr:conserved hypothetical protein [Ricinus communis]